MRESLSLKHPVKYNGAYIHLKLCSKWTAYMQILQSYNNSPNVNQGKYSPSFHPQKSAFLPVQSRVKEPPKEWELWRHLMKPIFSLSVGLTFPVSLLDKPFYLPAVCPYFLNSLIKLPRTCNPSWSWDLYSTNNLLLFLFLPSYIYGSQTTMYRNLFSPSTMWDPGKLRLWGTAASACTAKPSHRSLFLLVFLVTQGVICL